MLKKAFSVRWRLFIGAFFLLGIMPIWAQDGNLIVNPSMEVMEPNFWNKWNDGEGGAQLIWADDTSHSWYRSFKVVKPSATTNPVGWVSVNNADLYWNNAAADRLYNLSFWAKTEGVNTDPSTEDGKIGVKYEFFAGGTLLGEQFISVDQTVSSTSWTKYTGGLLIPAGDDPDSVVITAYMGKDATGTVWFDDIGAGSDPWSMWPFNSDAETPVGWLYWTAGPDKGQFFITDETAHTGKYSVLLQDFDNDADELVWYSEPWPAKPNTWYKVSGWVKWDSVNTDPKFLPSNVTPVRDNNRIGWTFFFHRDPIKKQWSLTPGDLFFYIDQRDSSSDWTKYEVIFKSPEDADGVSIRARFTSFPTGKAWFDDFAVEEITVSDEEILVNPSMEVMEPNFWNKWNDGEGGAQLIWADDTSHSWYRSFKVVKPSATTNPVGWVSVNNADLYWNNAAADRLYNLSFWAKTEGVNTDPSTEDGKIGVKYEFFAGGTLLGEQFISVDQTVSSTSWTKYTGGLLIPAGDDPDSVVITAYMGKDATGTVWFDDIGAGSDPWSMWPFNSDAETPVGWLYWTAGPDKGQFFITDETAHTGKYSVLLQDFDNDADELVWYSEPWPAKPNTWYKVSGWVKWDSVNTDPKFLPSNVTPVRDNNRIGWTFFFHRDPIKKQWSLTPGDLFFYISQQDSASDWTQYAVIYKSPEDADGVSLRARFTSFPTGKAWFDDFSVREVTAVVTGIEDEGAPVFTGQLPDAYDLIQNFPNPFNPGTTIRYTLQKSGDVEITIFNVLGQPVKTLVRGYKTAGTHDVYWNGTNEQGALVPSGVYFYRLRTNGLTITKRMVLSK